LAFGYFNPPKEVQDDFFVRRERATGDR
jgi:hypothetical protein